MTGFALIYRVVANFAVAFAVVLDDASMILCTEYSRQVVSVVLPGPTICLQGTRLILATYVRMPVLK